MSLSSPRVRTRLTLALFALGWAAAVVVSAAGRPAQATRSDPAARLQAAGAPAAAQAAGFIGDDTCIACHESQGQSLRATMHGNAQNARTPSAKVNQACETCHGPGREHAES